jgi:hypothetical protein
VKEPTSPARITAVVETIKTIGSLIRLTRDAQLRA